MNLVDRLKNDWYKGKMIQQLIIVNAFVFFGVLIINGILSLVGVNLYSFISRWVSLSPELNVFITAPWTIFTYGFLHDGFMHILFNMLWLYWIGKILEEYIGARKILPIYLYGVMAGGLLMILFYNVFPVLDPKNVVMVGASAGVMAIIWATVALLPDHKIGLFLFGSIPLVYIAAIMTGLDLISIAGPNAGGQISHLGGALMGYWFIKLYQKGTDLSIGINKVLDSMVGVFQSTKKRAPIIKITRDAKKKPSTKSTSKKTSLTQQEKIDAILDKINKSGYSSLSQKEKDFLKHQND